MKQRISEGRLKIRSGESGNIFFMLFGAVALVGIVGVATSNLIRGPLGTALSLNQKAKVDSQLQIARKLAALEATEAGADCDTDPFVEPLAPDTTGDCDDLLGAGTGCLPAQVGAAKTDGWGTSIGYCGWNHGPIQTDPGCPDRFTGANAEDKVVLAVISAGPDRTFQTTCANDPGYVTKGGDDIVFEWTYDEASKGVGDGLWTLKSGDPAAITTAKNVDFASGTTASFGSDAVLDLSGGGLFNLPNENAVSLCNPANKGVLRRFTNQPTDDQEILQICDGTSWQSAGGGAIDGLTDAYTDYVTSHNIIMGRTGAAALAAGTEYNMFIGDNAGATTANSTATVRANTAIGTDTLSDLTTGHSNTALGAGTLQRTSTGYANIAIGAADGTASALQNNTTGHGNVAVGYGALAYNKTNSESTAIGLMAMQWGDDTAAGGVTHNTAVGAYALQGSATPADNTGTCNTAIGHASLQGNSSGHSNTALGEATLKDNTTGTRNVAIGGFRDGEAALQHNDSGTSNVAIGVGALGNSNSSFNVAVGGLAGNSLTTGDSNILIGYNVNTPANNTSNHLNIGNTIYGDLSTDYVGIGTAAPGGALHVTGGKSIFDNVDTPWNQVQIGTPTSDGETGITFISGVTAYGAAPTSANGNTRIWGMGANQFSAGGNKFSISNASLGANVMTLQADGNVGIGDVSPAGLFTVGNGDLFQVSSTGNISIVNNNATEILLSGAGNTGNITATGPLYLLGGAGGAGDINFGSNNINGQMVLHNGNVGIGAAVPTVKMDIASDVEDGIRITEANNQTSLNPFFETRRARGTVAAPTIVANNDELMEFIVYGYDGAAYRIGAVLAFNVDGAPSVNDMPTRLDFNLQADGSGGWLGDSASVPEFTIKSSGILGINTATPNQGKLEVKGGSVCVDTDSDDNATSCIASESDMRLKKNVRDLDYSVETLMKLRPVQFDWRHDDPEILKHYPLISRFAGQPHSIGFLAQDVQKLVPEAIESETVGDAEVQYLQLDYTKLVPVMVKAAQEQQGDIIALNTEIETLKSELAQMRTTLSAMQSAQNPVHKTIQQEPLEEAELQPNYSKLIPAMVEDAQDRQDALTALKADNEKLKADLPQTQNALAAAQKDIEGLKAYTSYGSDKEKPTIMLKAIIAAALLLLIALAMICRRRSDRLKE